MERKQGQKRSILAAMLAMLAGAAYDEKTKAHVMHRMALLAIMQIHRPTFGPKDYGIYLQASGKWDRNRRLRRSKR